MKDEGDIPGVPGKRGPGSIRNVAAGSPLSVAPHGLRGRKSSRPGAAVSAAWSEDAFARLFEEEQGPAPRSYPGDANEQDKRVKPVVSPQVREAPQKDGEKYEAENVEPGHEETGHTYGFPDHSAPDRAQGKPEGEGPETFLSGLDFAALHQEGRSHDHAVAYRQYEKSFWGKWYFPLIAAGAIVVAVVIGPDLIYNSASSDRPSTQVSSAERWVDGVLRSLRLPPVFGTLPENVPPLPTQAAPLQSQDSRPLAAAAAAGAGAGDGVDAINPPEEGPIPPLPDPLVLPKETEVPQGPASSTLLQPLVLPSQSVVRSPALSSDESDRSDVITESGRMVRGVQSELLRLGYDVWRVDGLSGWRTRNAIRAFERDSGLTVDGVIDEQLLQRLGLEARP